MSTPSFGNDLSKLTVAQLKALCKERGITGYSKLNKPSLVQKIIGNSSVPMSDIGSPATALKSPRSIDAQSTEWNAELISSDSNIDLEGQIRAPYDLPPNRTAHAEHSSSLDAVEISLLRKAALPETREIEATETRGSHSGTLIVTSGPSQDISSAETLLINAICPRDGEKRQLKANHSKASGPLGIPKDRQSNKHPKRSVSPSVPEPESKKTKKTATISTLRKETLPQSSLPRHSMPQSCAPSSSIRLMPQISFPSMPLRASTVGDISGITQTQNPPQLHSGLGVDSLLSKTKSATTKKFKPLVASKVAMLPSSVLTKEYMGVSPVPNGKSTIPLETAGLEIDSEDLYPLRSFPVPECPRISLPPSLSQRKRVHRWALILSGLSDAERRQCILVSRMFRYAVYLSAGVILQREFSGKRLSDVLQKYPSAMTNLWPYLRQRIDERQFWNDAYRRSFPAHFFRTTDPISQHLWTSPDDERQIMVALRFTMTRLWFAISLGKLQSRWLRSVITSARAVVDDIWAVTVAYKETLYVLESTCEVIGRPAQNSHPLSYDTDDLNRSLIRADWSAYIERLQSDGSGPSASIMQQLKWANYEEYEKGISRLWLRRTEGEGEIGRAKRLIAERYVLACVVANSVSGKWMSSTQMAQEFAGLSEGVCAPASRPAQAQVNLFLPAHHHVESLHFTTARMQPLHSALAVVQTPAREYYILRDNGMQVGCEEEGVGDVWMVLLKCGPSGIPASPK